MKIATYEGIVEGGLIKLTGDVRLQEGVKVYVVVPQIETRSVPFIASPRLKHPEQAKDFTKKLIEESDAGV